VARIAGAHAGRAKEDPVKPTLFILIATFALGASPLWAQEGTPTDDAPSPDGAAPTDGTDAKGPQAESAGPPGEKASEPPAVKAPPEPPPRIDPRVWVKSASTQQALTRIHTHCQRSEFVDGLALTGALMQKGDLGRGALRNAWLARALCLSASGEGMDAQRAFATALHLDPTFRLQKSEGRTIPGPYHAALALLPPTRQILQSRVQWRKGDEKRGLLIHLLTDRMKLVDRVLLVDAHGEVLYGMPLAVERTVFVPFDEPAQNGGALLKLVDAHGNAVRDLAIPPKADKVQIHGENAEERDWLTLTGAGILVAGALAAATTGLYSVVASGGNLGPELRDSAGVAMAGALIFTGTILVGAGILGFQALSRQQDPVNKKAAARAKPAQKKQRSDF
jgi:hypothetical protein